MFLSSRIVCSLAVVVTLAAPSRAQCLEWDDRFASPGVNDEVDAATVFDDGTGPSLYIGGRFTVAGDVAASCVAKWDGVIFSPLDAGIADVGAAAVRALAVFDDGSGPALFAAGDFSLAGNASASNVAKWDGTSWSALGTGTNNLVTALAVYDDGSGSALYAAGNFTIAGGGSANHIARWSGSSWSALGLGANNTMNALAVFDDGSGAQLYAGGNFTIIGGIGAGRIAKWASGAWVPLALGLNSTVNAIAVFDDGSGSALYAGGAFTTAGGSSADRVAKWDGSNWSSLTSGTNGTVHALAAHDDGTGPALFVGGAFTMAGGGSASGVAEWNGAGWSALGGGANGLVRTLASFDDGAGAVLVAGGSFTKADGLVTTEIAQWDGAAWSPLADGDGILYSADAMTVHDDGSGAALFVSGHQPVNNSPTTIDVLRWDGSSWSTLGSGMNTTVFALASYDDGSGSMLYAGGQFITAGGTSVNRIARWDGTSWSDVGGGVTGSGTTTVNALIVFDDGTGPALYAGGSFTSAGGNGAVHVAKWNGANWSALGAGVGGFVHALAVFDDGTGPALYAGGNITGGVAKWNGATWSTFGSGPNGPVVALASFDDGSGAKLYAGGSFASLVGGGAVQYLASWDGSVWSALGGGTNGQVEALTVFDDGAGTALYAGGGFNMVEGNSYKRVAKWDGSAWSGLGAGIEDPIVFSLAVFDDGADGAPDLYAGGSFSMVDGKVSMRFAEWHGCPPGDAYCFGDGIDSVVTALCPCGNFGDAGRGCANSNSALGGARLIASGTTSPNTLVFTCDGIPNNSFCTFLRSNATDDSGFVFGDGIKCLNGTGIRFGAQNAGQGGNPPFTVASGAATVASGNTRYYQLHYRNPNLGFCPPETFNISNGYRVAW